ncbi:MAG TPA: YciI family protein [Pseudonocardiaceae bacterium]|nr:YciI family protein [Pseudonocardiaceae bacterium]
MRYLVMTKASDTQPDERVFTEMESFIDELTKAGIVLAAGGLDPTGTKLTSVNGEITVTDGPFTETNEAVGGFALVEVRTKEEAIELARRAIAIGGDGESLMQEVFGP